MTGLTAPFDAESSINNVNEINGSILKNGFEGDSIDVVRASDGQLTTLDNTRVLAADRAGVKVKAKLHDVNDPLPIEMRERFTTKKRGEPKTFGEALNNRIQSQNTGFRNNHPNGSPVTGSTQ